MRKNFVYCKIFARFYDKIYKCNVNKTNSCKISRIDMVFSSYSFIFLFLPIVLAGFYLLRLTKKALPVKLWLLAASLVFYGKGQSDYILMFCFSIALNYAVVSLMNISKTKTVKRVLLSVAVLWNIGLLVYFKYTNFIFANLNRIPGIDLTLLDLILPIGISFFTFQILAYTIDYYKGEVEKASFLDYSLFVSFFPQLIVGPVVMHGDLIPQLEDRSIISLDSEDIKRGILLFSIGCAKKTVVANPLIKYAADFYSGDVTSYSTVAAWGGVLAFTFAYYFDFSGYIDMARGLGYMFGIKLPINFDSPYKARNFADFWRRWNMTISGFFNNTVFANLFHFGDRIPKLIFATLATFFVSGIWHGAGWNFILWGLINGILVCAANIMMLYRLRLPSVIAYPATFIGSALVRVMFDSPSVSAAVNIYKKLFSLTGGVSDIASSFLTFVSDNTVVAFLIAAGALICFCLPNSNRISENGKLGARHAVLAAVLFVMSLAFMGRVSTFLYFNF